MSWSVGGTPHWRSRLLDAVLLAMAVAVALSVLTSQLPHRVPVALTAFASLAVLVAREKAPLELALLSFGCLAVGSALSPESVGLQFAGFVLVFPTVGSCLRGRSLWLAAAAGGLLLAFETLVLPAGGGYADFLLSFFICEGALALGALLGHRGQHVRRLAAEVALAEERQQLRTRAALAEERGRIARELHDVVSHGLSVVVVQTQAARGSLSDARLEPSGHLDGAMRHLDAVEATARDALAEMRRMLGLLQLDDTLPSDAPEPPSPRLSDLPALVERARATGLTVSEDLPGSWPDLGAGLELAIYRIVQESLTNAIKHAPGGDVALAVRVDAGRVLVEAVSRPGARPTELSRSEDVGHGLIGMRERVTTYGGRLTAEPLADGGFRVHAHMPLRSSEHAR